MVSRQSEIHVQDWRAGMTVLWMSGRHQTGPVQNLIFNHRATACVIKTGFVFLSMTPMSSSVVKRMQPVKIESVAVFVLLRTTQIHLVGMAAKVRRPKKTEPHLHHRHSVAIQPDNASIWTRTLPVGRRGRPTKHACAPSTVRLSERTEGGLRPPESQNQYPSMEALFALMIPLVVSIK